MRETLRHWAHLGCCMRKQCRICHECGTTRRGTLRPNTVHKKHPLVRTCLLEDYLSLGPSDHFLTWRYEHIFAMDFYIDQRLPPMEMSSSSAGRISLWFAGGACAALSPPDYGGGTEKFQFWGHCLLSGILLPYDSQLLEKFPCLPAQLPHGCFLDLLLLKHF